MIETNPILSVFDAILVVVDEVARRAYFVSNGLEFQMGLSAPMSWDLGTIGVLRFNDEGNCILFSAYPDRRLRCAPARAISPAASIRWRIRRSGTAAS